MAYLLLRSGLTGEALTRIIDLSLQETRKELATARKQLRISGGIGITGDPLLNNIELLAETLRTTYTQRIRTMDKEEKRTKKQLAALYEGAPTLLRLADAFNGLPTTYPPQEGSMNSGVRWITIEPQ
ncbi:MAG TPA: hypothetical protein VJB87_01615 [Candidatus Nanoarchaeia archaeon]|nr:hypothetical protein [Candidatus Nanoarchaeia archaeon]